MTAPPNLNRQVHSTGRRGGRFSKDELDRLRQWHNALEDMAPNYLEEGDKALKQKIDELLKRGA